MSHTPGPWVIIGRSIYQVEEVGGREVVHGNGIKGRDDANEAAANARLLAAAPELLEALKWAIHHVENVFALAGPHDRELPQLEHARAAIAKVKGRA